MAWYEVFLRRSVIEEVKVNVSANGRIQAAKVAINRANSQELDWKTTGTIDEQPYSIKEEKLNKKQLKWMPISSCSQCNFRNSNSILCEHPILVEKYPFGDKYNEERHMSEQKFFNSVLSDCPLEDKK